MKVLIIGGVAGGASAAARLRRLDETAEIILIERGDYVSYANCGLPYFIGGEITEKSALAVQTPETLRMRMNLDVRTGHEALEIFRDEKKVRIWNIAENTVYEETYDRLILSTGAEPIRPPLPGADDPRVFTLRTIPDTYRIHDFINENNPKRALVVGGGYIGLEMAENLSKAGLAVTVAEMADHVIAPLDADMAGDVHSYIRSRGIELLLGNGVQSIEPAPDSLHVTLARGTAQADMVLLSIGVKPDTALAKKADLAVNPRGAITVDRSMRTSDPNIYAVGDAVEITQLVGGKPGYIPLAGPANKQGRIAADSIAGIHREYRGTQGTALIRFFGMTVGTTGLNETAAAQAEISYDKVYLLALSHAGYYPGAEPMNIKVLFEKESGRILGAQIAGFGGVDKRLDILAAAIRHGLDAYDLSELELGYAPPFSSAKDPVNMAGFMIQNLLEGRVRQFHWQQVPELIERGAQILDVSTPEEFKSGHIENSVNIPLDELRDRLGELNKKEPACIYCRTGQRSYTAGRILEAHGFTASHLAGGYRLYASAALAAQGELACVRCR
ncbi:FAD-dependent oxidoreductase [Breznakiella homolactica]|uniref:FAD-dependent oxidoreductase n=1 Tax=Breznakiella homolactica TaxID=2798577 RepID=A0A7T8BAC1_9SPIR|nr:FAD-dependent oxidoreductase [Breznakiella homolactica]QQO09362.1 FAD-dependent oxidoreductase [Breznakiella homolactica]